MAKRNDVNGGGGFHPEYSHMTYAEKREAVDRLVMKDGWDREEAESEVGLKKRRSNGRYPHGEESGGEVVDEYIYLDADGDQYLMVERTADKQFPQSHWTGREWKPGKPKLPNGQWAPKIPYFLPQLIAAPPDETIFITEGEKDALRLMDCDLTATCASEAKWNDPALNKWFVGRKRVFVFEDNDAKGRAYARQVAAHLVKIVGEVRIVKLPGLKQRQDVSDWLDAGHDKAALLAECEKADVFEPWLAGCQTNKSGVPLANLANVMIALRGDPALNEIVAYDEMEWVPMLLSPVPGKEAPLEFAPRPLADADVTAIQEWIQLHGLSGVGKDTVHQAVDLRARECAFHPVRDYLSGLTWDGRSRLDGWLTTYFGAEAKPYTARVGCMFLIAMVARIFDPGCKADYMAIFEGEQGDVKSTALEVLAGRWFSDQMPPVESKDASQHLRGKWLIEIAELHRMMSNNVEVEAVKAFITRRVERYRPSYGRHDVHEARQCVLVGSTNKDEYLRDETGNRRFWPVKIGEIKLDVLRRDRDQLFAEAVALYRRGEHWWPERKFEREFIKPEQDARYEHDEWEAMIAKYLSTESGKVKLKDIGFMALHIRSRSDLGRAEQNRIKKALARLGWVRAGTRGGYPLWGRGPKAAPVAASGPGGDFGTRPDDDLDPRPGDDPDDPA